MKFAGSRSLFMSRHDSRVSLLQMQDYSRLAQAVTHGRIVEDLTSDDVLRLAIERALEVVGEAETRLPVELIAR
jgi:uncharacterized protein with HEPN domain